VKYAWIAQNKAVWPVSMTCEVLGVSTSGYFEHQRRRRPQPVVTPSGTPGGGRVTKQALLVHVRAIHAQVKGEYGWPRMWKELLARGIRVGKQRVQRLMHEHGIRARGKKKFIVTTDSKHDLPIAKNLLDRNFNPAAPDQVWRSEALCRFVWTATA
jgi:putative transposase